MKKGWRRFFSKQSKTGESLRTLIFALTIVLLIRSSIAAPYKIPTGSMIPTLQIGDHIFVSKLSYGLKLPFTNLNVVTWDKPTRGDVVVFRYPEDPSKDFIKRIVGIPGDTIEIREGQLYLNGEPIERNESSADELNELVEEARYEQENLVLYREQLGEVSHYILHHRDFYFGALSDRAPVVVSPDHYFVMGDNRDNSKDSREWGQVDFKAIRGRAQIVFFSWRKKPLGVRWSRFGSLIR